MLVFCHHECIGGLVSAQTQISLFCRVLLVGLDPCLSLHCCVISSGLKLMARSSIFPKLLKNFPMWRTSNFGSEVTTEFFLLSFTVSLVACPKLPGDPMASCGLWAEESQHVQPSPALLVPMATLLCPAVTLLPLQLFEPALHSPRKKDFL